MPSQLALIICIIFVLVLLATDHKQAPRVSYVLWIPTAWMLLISGKPLGQWFGSGGDMETGSPLDRALCMAIICIGLIILTKKRFDWAKAIRGNSWLFLLFGYMLLSILWSDIPFISFKRWTREMVSVVVALLILSEQNPRKALECVLRRSVYILIPFSFLLVNYFPDYGRDYNIWTGELMWTGVASQKNGLGRLCFISALFLIWTLVRRWQKRDLSIMKYQIYFDVFLLIMTFYLLKGPGIGKGSASSVLALCVGVTMLCVLLWMKKTKLFVKTNIFSVVIGVGFIFGTVTVFVAGSSVRMFTSIMGRDVTLTGRTDIWAALLPAAMKQPILGHGIGAFWTDSAQELYFKVNQSHNGYLDILLDYGFIGLFFYLMFLLFSCRMARRELAYDYYWGSLWMSYLFMAVIHNISEASIKTFLSQQTVLLLFLVFTSSISTGKKR